MACRTIMYVRGGILNPPVCRKCWFPLPYHRATFRRCPIFLECYLSAADPVMKNQKPTGLKILYIIVFLVLVGYTYWQRAQEEAGRPDPPTVTENGTADSGLPGGERPARQEPESRPPIDRSSTSEAATASSDTLPSEAKTPANPAARFGVEDFQWKKVDRSNFTSPQGLVYTMGPNREHRLEHLFRHAEDQPDRPGRHGVFDGSPDEILQRLDQAYKLVKFKSSDVRSEPDGQRTAYTINMKKRVGYIGGETGKRQDHPTARKIKLVLEGARVITAYPLLYWFEICRPLGGSFGIGSK